MARFIEYVELGLQPQRAYMNEPKKPAQEVSLVFELLSPDNIHEVDISGEKRMIADKIFITMTKKLAGRAKFFKLMTAMRYGRDSVKHMKNMLGEAFILNITHNTSKKDPTKIYANVGTKDDVGVRGPFEVNLRTRKSKKVDIPKPLSKLKIFLMNYPTKESWDSLFIDGTYENKQKEEVSKNFIQNKILAALDFEGSALQNLLAGTDDLPELEEDLLDDLGTEEEEPVKKRAKTKTKTKVKSKTKKKVAPKTKKKIPVKKTAKNRRK